MSKTPIDPENISPYKLLDNFSKNRVIPCIILALLIHVVVIGGLSSNYIYTTWIDPSAGEVVSDDDNPDVAADGQKPDDATGEDGDGSDGQKTGEDGSTTDKPTGDVPEGHNADAPVIKRVTDTEDPDNIPDDPDGGGISLDD